MRYVDEFRKKDLVAKLASAIKGIAPAKQITFMEVCGTHTQSVHRFGLDALLLGIAAVIIGGRDSFLGPALAGILLGVVRSGVIWFLSAQWEDAVTFTLLILFLFLRPQGLLGKKRRLEVQV